MAGLEWFLYVLVLASFAADPAGSSTATPLYR